ncbi:RagB/SusD family nutrient uptake outer membrane protein [Membranihabitans marinus]|uniref:RagB/SusD family nutrient uptake outer membrane protein n=1 Tax=Membranihabitans marinus TaxID=1227546 RepID=UPI001F44C1F0|nr:RagB/SusD family nutrient uptake outer membrane protein [Membranihabitans marinus]
MIVQTNLIKKICFSFFVLFFFACEDELNLNPKNQYANESFWTNETNAMLALTGVYRGPISHAGTQTKPTDWWSYYGVILLEHATDNAYDRRGDNSNFVTITNGNLLANNSYILEYWKSSYKRVAICNDFLENIIQVDEINETTKNRMIAEVKFIRACQYFYLSQFWGSVPLVTNTLTPDEANQVEKVDRSTIVEFVIKELNEAVPHLPRYKDIPLAESGRASRQAALGFLGRIYLAEKRFTEASSVYKEIIDYNDNIIDPDYRSIFLAENETSAENIFSVKYLEGDAPNSVQLYSYPSILQGFSLINPLGSLAESFEFNDGTPFSYDDPRYNSRNLSENRDPRFSYTLLADGDSFSGQKFITHPDSINSKDVISYANQATRTGYACIKFCQEFFSGDPRNDYGADVPLLRYAEILLSYLEAKLEAGDPITQELLDQTINKVRGRESVNMPSVTETDPDLLRPLLRNERRVELAMEGLRYWDLLRWGIIGETLQGDFWGAPYPDSQRYATVTKKIDSNARWYVTSKNFRVGQDEFWPIPESESNINPKLIQ